MAKKGKGTGARIGTTTKPKATPSADSWMVYVLQSQVRAVTYVGISKDVKARLAQHNGETKGGAKSTRTARPWTIARTLGPYETRGEAQSAEYALKQKPAHERLLNG
ncbi:MAG: GIY-YIG nuclease family protein [Planctomycetes bacterium]|nr:GIY-YIG nuclease family protein [Planctomycetota bacterium]